jgi:hypothetical protein
VQLAQNYNITDGSRRWFTGDFTYDGNADFADLVKLAQNYNTALPAAAAAMIPGASAQFASDLSAAMAGVPEPSGVGIVAVGLVGISRRRRRRRII